MMRIEDNVVNADGEEVVEYTYIDSIKVPSKSTPIWRCGSSNCLIKAGSNAVSLAGSGACVVIPQYMWWNTTNPTEEIKYLQVSERGDMNVTGVRFSPHLTDLQDYAFERLNFPHKLCIIPRNIEVIHENAFYQSNIQMIILPYNDIDNYQYVYAEAFLGTNLQRIVFEGTEDQFEDILRSNEPTPSGGTYWGIEALKQIFGTKKYIDADGNEVDTDECVITVTYNNDYNGKYKPMIDERGYHIS